MDILVSGASIAGPTAAFWLARAGHRVTVIERADSLRMAGQNVDVRGTGREVLRRMGIADAVAARTTGEVGLRFVGGSGVTLAEFPASDDGRDGATAEIEILRGTLAQLLVDAGRESVNYVFGDQIEQLTQDTDGVTVTTVGGITGRYDAVILADGSRSRLRDRLFADVGLRRLGLYTAYGTIPRLPSDDQWWNWYNATGGRSITVRPDDVGTTRVGLSFLSDDDRLEGLDGDRLRAAVAAVYDDVGWQAPRICRAIATTDEFYVDYLTQVMAPTWARGRVILCGDAAWSATPLSGMGTTLALTGAYLLAGELATASTVSAAVAGYERRMRPLVDTAQKLPPGTPRLAHPRTRLELCVFRLLIRAAGSRPGRAVAARFVSTPRAGDELPSYPALPSGGPTGIGA